MGIIKLTKDDIISNKMTLNKSQISYDTALVSNWESDAKTSFETLQNYNTKLNNREYLSSDDLKSYKSAVDSFVENNNRLRRLNKIFGQGYTDEQEKEWNDAITSLQSGYKEASDYFSQFKDENEFKDTLAAIKEQEEMRYVDVEAGMAEINSVLSGEKLTTLKEERAILGKGITLSHRDNGVYLRKYGYNRADAEKRLAELEKEITAIEEPAMRKKEYLTQAKYLQNYLYFTQNDVSLNEIKSHLSDEDPIAYTSPDGKNMTWQKLYDNKKYEKNLDAMYKKYSAMPDWSEKSKFVSKAGRNGKNLENSDRNLLLEYIYGDDEIRDSITISRYGKASTETYGNAAPLSFYDYGEDGYDSLNDKEKAILTYLSKDYDSNPDAYDEFNKFIKGQILDRHNKKEIDDAYSKAQKYPVISSLYSVGYSLMGGVEHLFNALTGEAGSENKNAALSSAIRQGVSDKVDWEIGNFDAFDFIYNTGMSMADSSASMAVFGKAGVIALGLSAAAQATNDALDRGMNNKQAFWNGLASGMFEMIFETVSIGQFSALKESLGTGIKNIVTNMGKSMLVNASEETLTEIANIVYDTVMNLDFSNSETKMRSYVASGMTLEEAEKQVKKDMTRQVAESAASGALMGLGFGGIGSAMSQIKAKAVERNIKSVINNLINIGLSALDTDAYVLAQQAQSKINRGMSLSAQEINDLQRAVMKTVINADISTIKQEVETRLIELGEGESASEVADVIVKQFLGEELTESEKDILKNSKPALDFLITFLIKKSDTEGMAQSSPVTESSYSQQIILNYLKSKHTDSPFVDGTIDDSVIDFTNSTKGEVATKNGNKTNWSDLDAYQQTAIIGLSKFAKGLGMDIVWISDGLQRKINGAFEIDGNRILIDIHAGKDKINNSDIRDTIILTASHEMVHWARYKAIEIYRKLEDFVFYSFALQGYTKEAVINNRRILLEMAESEREENFKKENPDKEYVRKAYSDEDVAEEVVARACEDLLANSEKFKQALESMTENEKKTLLDKLKEIITNIKNWINKFLSEYNSNSFEAKVMRVDMARFKKQLELFEQMIEDIVDSFEKLKDVVNLAFDKPQLKATAYFGIIPAETLSKIEKAYLIFLKN